MTKSDRKELFEELSRISNGLSPGEFSGGFRTPDNYFDTLPNKIQGKIGNARSNQVPDIGFKLSWKPAMAIAAIVIAVALTSGLLLLRDGKYNGHLAGFDDAFVLEYLVSYADVDPHFFYDMVLESNLSNDEILFGFMTDNDIDDHQALFFYVNSLLDYHWIDTESLLTTDN